MGTSHPTQATFIDDPVHEAAARWHDRLQCDPVSTEDRAASEHWLGQSPGHRHAYAAVERVWAPAQLLAEDPRILALRQEAALRLSRRAACHRLTLSRTLPAAALQSVVRLIGISV